MRYFIALVSWTLLAFLALAASRPAIGGARVPGGAAAPVSGWSTTSQGFPAFGDAGPIH
jgi:hypothetical protein